MLNLNTPWHFSCARCGFGMLHLAYCHLSFVIVIPKRTPGRS